MAERSAITQVVQLGMEVTPGTAVAATKRLQSLDFETKVMANVDKFRPQGFKLDTVTAEEREWTEATIKGQPTYTEIIYPLASVITTTGMGPTTISDGLTDTTGRKWTFEMNDSAPDVPQTFTVEQGSSVRAHKYAGGQFKELTFKFTREKLELGGALLAQLLTDGITLTGGTTSPALIPVLAKQITCYLDTTSGGLGTTKLPRLFSGDLTLNNRFGPVWVVDAAQASWAATVETVPAATFKAIVEADAAGMALLGYLRSSTTYFLRVDAVGPNIYTGGVTVNYEWKTDMAVEVTNIEPFTDQQGVFAIGFEFTIVHDAGWGKGFHSEVTNKVTAL